MTTIRHRHIIINVSQLNVLRYANGPRSEFTHYIFQPFRFVNPTPIHLPTCLRSFCIQSVKGIRIRVDTVQRSFFCSPPYGRTPWATTLNGINVHAVVRRQRTRQEGARRTSFNDYPRHAKVLSTSNVITAVVSPKNRRIELTLRRLISNRFRAVSQDPNATVGHRSFFFPRRYVLSQRRQDSHTYRSQAKPIKDRGRGIPGIPRTLNRFFCPLNFGTIVIYGRGGQSVIRRVIVWLRAGVIGGHGMARACPL